MEIRYGSLNLRIGIGFYAYESEECLNVVPFECDAAINLSSARRTDRSDVAEADVRKFSDHEELAEKTVESVSYAGASGFKVSGIDDEGTFWLKWFLRKGPVIAFITYNTQERLLAEEKVILEMISSLEIAA